MGEEINSIDEEKREEALSLLNRATEEWKETGELKTNIGKPPKPFKKRLKSFFSRITPTPKVKHSTKIEKKEEENKDREELDRIIQQLNKVYKS